MDPNIESVEVDISDIEMALAGLDMPELVETSVESDVGEIIDDGAIEAAVNAIEAEEARAEIYEAADVGGDVDTETPAPAPIEAKPVKVAKAKKAKKEKIAAAPRVNVNDLAPEAFVLTLADADADLAANKDAVLARRPTQKKVAEKFDNLLVSIAGGRAPSKFTMDCFRVLHTKGSATSAEFVAALEATAKKHDTSGTYNIGTARSQAGQMMSLFPALKIATREGNKITLNADSVIADALGALIAA